MEEPLTGVLLVEAQLGLYLDGIELFREGFALFFLMKGGVFGPRDRQPSVRSETDSIPSSSTLPLSSICGLPIWGTNLDEIGLKFPRLPERFELCGETPTPPSVVTGIH